MTTPFEALAGLQVLIVEDEGLIAEELRERITHFGAIVADVVDTAEQAVAAAERATPDVVLMDVRLRGERDGIDAARTIRARLDIPVVYLTAHSDRATLDRAKDTAPFGYLLKPFRGPELAVAIELAVHRHAMDRRLREREQRSMATLVSLGDGAIATDLEGRLTFMNPAAEALTAWTLDQASGIDAARVFRITNTAGSRMNPTKEVLGALATVRFDDGDVVLTSRYNRRVVIDYGAAPIVDQEGHAIGCVIVFREAQARRLGKQALRRAEEELSRWLKRSPAGRQRAEIEQKSGESPAPPAVEGQVPIVYMVDEDPSFVIHASHWLRAQAFRVESFRSIAAFLEARQHDDPGCVLIDVQAPGHDDGEWQRRLFRGDDAIPVIYLTAGSVVESALAMTQGEAECLVKPITEGALLRAVNGALARDIRHRAIRRTLADLRARYEGLSAREREVLALIVGRLRNREIASQLGISERTVKAHRAHVMQKLNTRSVVDLTRLVDALGV